MRPSTQAKADGGNPLPICIRNREWIVNRYQLDASIALRFLGTDMPVRTEERDEDEKALKHLRECPKCRAWVHEIVPADMFRRQSRLVRYCCAGMFCAVEEPREVSVSFELFRGEDPCWKIDEKRAFISYCPWCGKKLPNQPFIPEE
jgi:hypothetical protein